MEQDMDARKHAPSSGRGSVVQEALLQPLA